MKNLPYLAGLIAADGHLFKDGDGSVYIDKRKRYGIINHYVRIEIASQSGKFLDDIKDFLYEFGINCGQVTNGRRTLRIRIYSNNANAFIDKIGFSHPAKILPTPKPQGVD